MTTDNEDGTDLDEDFAGAEDEVEEGPGAEPKPGDDLFGDVVEEQPRAGAPIAPSGDDGHLRDSVAGIYEMVKDLEVQLNHMISINEGAERDLEAARKRQQELEKERTDLKRRIEKMELDAQSSAELREELRHMTRENERLIEKLRSAETQTEHWEQQRKALGAKVGGIQSEREELREEVECLEEQLGQTVQYIDRLRDDLKQTRDAKQQQARKTDLIEQRLHVVTEERDALRQELNESRSALEEIRRSIMDTNIQSQLSYYDT